MLGDDGPGAWRRGGGRDFRMCAPSIQRSRRQRVGRGNNGKVKLEEG